jgi:hypothetical protein
MSQQQDQKQPQQQTSAILDRSLIETFDRIYATDLVYVRDCWRLCGDAHCCNFSRYKSQFSLIGHQTYQQLPLLPGEWEYLQYKGYLASFGEIERSVIDYSLGDLGVMKIEFLIGRSRPCACEHATRTTTCRLYPLLPLFDISGACVGVDTNFGIFEEIEELAGMDRACEIREMPLREMNKFLVIASAIGRQPTGVFYVTAYQLAKRHARERLRQECCRTSPAASGPALRALESSFLLRRLFDQNILRPQIERLARQFRGHYGPRFQLLP